MATDGELASAQESGIRRLVMTSVDAAGVERARIIPSDRMPSAVARGVHASVSSVALFTPHDEPVDAVGMDAVVGDLLVRPDAARLAVIDAESQLGWAPADLCWPDGSPYFGCGRDAVRRATGMLGSHALMARVGFELEFTLTVTGSTPLLPAHNGPAYGQRPLLQNQPFIDSLLDALETADVPVLQLHAEHGLGQMEISLGPREPLDACDDYLLARLLVERTSSRHGLTAHFEPIPPVGDAANGMHIHLSVMRDRENLLSPTAAGVPAREGAAVIAGILDVLPAATALLAGSPLSYERLRPGRWSGASLCWGVGNREAAVRYVSGTPDSGAGGANIEIKPGDASANPYFAVAALLIGARDGIDRSSVPAAPVNISPGNLTEAEREAAGIRSLPGTLPEALALLRESATLRDGLGDQLVDLYTAVRMPRS